MAKRTAVGYLRVSGKSQLDGNGPERQEELIRAFAAKNGIEVTQCFTEAYTGTEADRPMFSEMLADLLANGCRIIIVECLDRLARDLIVQMGLLNLLIEKGVVLISAMTGENVTEAVQDDPMRKAMIQIQGVFAELEKALLVRKMSKAKAAIRKTGVKCDGRKAYGEKEGEQAILDRVRSLRRKPRKGVKLTWDEVAAALNAEGSLNRSGGQWTRQSVHKVCKQAGIK